MKQHLYLKYPPTCESCGKTPPAKVGIWHINEGDVGIYLCNKCKEVEDENNDADTLEA